MYAKRIALAAILATLALPATSSAYPRATVASVVAPRPAVALGPEGDEYPWWGNVTTSDESTVGIADCTFATAADWEMIALHRAPSEAALLAEFHRAGGTNIEGIGSDVWEAWWEKHGIAGVRVRLIHRPTSWLDALIQIHGSVLASVNSHEVVVDGFNSTGPELVTYGSTEQVTWHEWDGWEDEILVPVVTQTRE
jgi:hypothetical protein